MLPAGFELEDAKPTKPEPTTPDGFVVQGSVIPEIRQASPRGLFEKVTSFFRDEDKLTARSANIYALSEATGLPISEVNKNYDQLRYSSNITGIDSEPKPEEIMSAVMIPGVVAGAGAAIATYGLAAGLASTAAGIIAFGALDKAIPTDKVIAKMEEEGVDDLAIHTVEIADFVGKAMIAGGIFKKSGQLKESFMKQKITEYKLPETVSLSAEQVRSIYIAGPGMEGMTTAEQRSLWASLELNSFDRRAAIEHGISINVPSEKVVKIVDNPLWAKVKNMFGMTEEATVVSSTKAGKPGQVNKGLEAPGAVSEKPKSDPVAKLIGALKEAKDVRSKQETLYEQERSKKFGKLMGTRSKAKGEAGFYKELGALKGELPKVEFEAIRGKVGQEDIDSLFQMIRETPKIGEWEKINAMSGLAKMFGEEGGRVPTQGELALLNEVFGEEFTKAILDKRTLWNKMAELGQQIANIPRSLMSSGDMSGLLRQGAFMIGRPRQFLPAAKKMFTTFFSEKAYDAVQDAIITHPDYQLARDSDLFLADKDMLLGTREESFMSNLAEKIGIKVPNPLSYIKNKPDKAPFKYLFGDKIDLMPIGQLVRASERSYISLLNKLRFDVFVDMLNKAEISGRNPRKDRDLTKSLADYINNATGRGKLPGGFEKSAVLLNSLFFSPRLIMSRINLLNPAFYIKQDSFVRKEALKDLLKFFGLGLTVLGMAKMSGAEVGDKPTSSDFGKIKSGNTRFDIWAGFQQYIVVMSRLWSGKYVKSTTGEEVKLGDGYKPRTKKDVLQDFAEGKLAPIPSFIVAMLEQQDFEGKPVTLKGELAKRFIPMMTGDMYDIAKDDPTLLPAGLTSFFGVGVSTYEDKQRKGF